MDFMVLGKEEGLGSQSDRLLMLKFIHFTFYLGSIFELDDPGGWSGRGK